MQACGIGNNSCRISSKIRIGFTVRCMRKGARSRLTKNLEEEAKTLATFGAACRMVVECKLTYLKSILESKIQENKLFICRHTQSLILAE